MKKRINYITPSDLEDIIKSAGRDRNNNYLIPETLEIYVVPTREERIQAEIARLEKELEGMKEPTTEELIEDAKVNHPFYVYGDEVKSLKEELKRYGSSRLSNEL